MFISSRQKGSTYQRAVNRCKRVLISGLFLSFATACSTEYVPSQKMLNLKKAMSEEQAIQVLQSTIWGTTDHKGICGARGFWYDKESDMSVQKDKISLLAHKRGRELKKASKGFDDIVVFEKQYYRYEFLFNTISNIFIYDDPLLLSVFPECNLKDGNERYLIIDLFTDKNNNLKFIVFIDDFDTIMAALSILLPEKKYILK